MIQGSPRPVVDPVLPLVVVGLPPLVLLAAADPLSAVAALAVGVGAAAFAYATSRRLSHALAAASMALLFLPADPVAILVTAGLLLLLAGAHLLRLPHLLLLAAPAFVLQDASGPWVAATGLAVLLAAPDSDGRGPRLSHAGPVAAGLLLVAGAFWAPVAAAVGLAAGFTARGVVRHPGRSRFAGTLGGVGLWGSLLPASLLFLLAALGRIPPLGPRSLLLVGWSAVGLGGLVVLALLGLEVGLRSTGSAPARAAAVPLVAVGLPALLVAAGALTVAVHVAGLAWVALAPAAVVGVQRLGRAAGRHGGWVGVVAAAAALVALPIRLLF